MDFPKSLPGVGLVGGQFVDENPSIGQQGSLIPSAWGNAVTQELLNVIQAAGLEPDEEQTNQLLVAIEKMQVDLSSESGMVVFDTPGVYIWDVPEVLRSGKKKAIVTVKGGGASGGYATAAGTASGGGGEGGEINALLDLSGLVSIPCTVGAGGVPPSAAGVGGTGGASSFGDILTAIGGFGGMNSCGGGDGGGPVPPTSPRVLGYSGARGKAGGSAYPLLASGSLEGGSGTGLRAFQLDGPGNGGDSPGHGGSGARAGYKGGNGAAGKIVVRW